MESEKWVFLRSIAAVTRGVVVCGMTVLQQALGALEGAATSVAGAGNGWQLHCRQPGVPKFCTFSHDGNTTSFAFHTISKLPYYVPNARSKSCSIRLIFDLEVCFYPTSTFRMLTRRVTDRLQL